MTSTSDPDDCADKLARMLDDQAKICRGIRDLSERQQRLVEERREDELLALLSDKQALLDRHERLLAQSQPHRAAWEEVRGRAGEAARNRVEAAWESLKSVLNDIVTLEDASRRQLEDRKSAVSMNIGRIQLGKIATKAYGGGALPPPRARFSDRKG